MQPYEQILIDGHAKMIHPFYPECYPAGNVNRHGRSSSVIEVTRFELPSFTMELEELAAWFRMELARIVVDQCSGSCQSWRRRVVI